MALVTLTVALAEGRARALVLPDTGQCSSSNPCLSITQIDQLGGALAMSLSSQGAGLNVSAVFGDGIYATTTGNSQPNGYDAIHGHASGNTTGVVGENTSNGTGVFGTSATWVGVQGSTTASNSTGAGVRGSAAAPWPAAGVYGTNSYSGGTAIVGMGTNATSSVGIYGQAATMGVQGYATAASGIGTSGVAGGSGGHAIDAICNGSCVGTGYAGYFTGNVYATGTVTASSFVNLSDARLKTDVRDLPFGVAQLLRLRPVTFKRKEGTDKASQVGFIAQEVQKIFPELVQTDATSGKLSVNYVGLVPVAVKAIAEQQRIIDRQEARIAALERANGPLHASLLPAGVEIGGVLCLLPLGLVLGRRRRKGQSASE